jgi:hypothetical protein
MFAHSENAEMTLEIGARVKWQESGKWACKMYYQVIAK